MILKMKMRRMKTRKKSNLMLGAKEKLVTQIRLGAWIYDSKNNKTTSSYSMFLLLRFKLVVCIYNNNFFI